MLFGNVSSGSFGGGLVLSGYVTAAREGAIGHSPRRTRLTEFITHNV